MLKSALRTSVATLGLAAVSFPALAATTPPDFSGLTGAVDWSTVTAAIVTIAGTVATVFVTVRGAKWVLGMIRA